MGEFEVVMKRMVCGGNGVCLGNSTKTSHAQFVVEGEKWKKKLFLEKMEILGVCGGSRTQ